MTTVWEHATAYARVDSPGRLCIINRLKMRMDDCENASMTTEVIVTVRFVPNNATTTLNMDTYKYMDNYISQSRV